MSYGRDDVDPAYRERGAYRTQLDSLRRLSPEQIVEDFDPLEPMQRYSRSRKATRPTKGRTQSRELGE